MVLSIIVYRYIPVVLVFVYRILRINLCNSNSIVEDPSFHLMHCALGWTIYS